MFDPKNIISFLISPPIEGGLLIAKIILVIFSIFFVGGTIYLLFRTSWLKNILIQDLVEVLTYQSYWTRQAARRWKNIKKRLRTGSESEYKLAVMEADAMLNERLGRTGYLGESLGQKLEKVSKETISYLDQVWEAHKVRNDVVHDPDYRLTLEEANSVLDIYGRALRDLETF